MIGVKAQALSWGVKHKEIVKTVSFTLDAGQNLGLIGPNGSGKSSLLKLLTGIRPAHSGDIWLGDQALKRLSQRQIARQVAFVEQQAETIDRITVQQVVSLGRTPWLSLRSPWSDKDDQLVIQALTEVGLQDKRERLWHSLSGGERQRVQIARALAQQPQLLVLDEPANHLDIRYQLMILDLALSLPVTTVMALHDLNQALRCDQVGVMHHGELIALGAPREVLTQPLIETVFGVQSHQCEHPIDQSPYLHFYLKDNAHHGTRRQSERAKAADRLTSVATPEPHGHLDPTPVHGMGAHAAFSSR
ncbi:hypothetical protein BFW38_13095 [Terasakiispira papahanaumokuakeensis]|uniref:ABC transporter domain-containing protein n=1 Tax=Terasakiispira papahanaumokuakeensis TaxID=197479 RepID=A0A1E2VBF9_9GAMM|nr:ABC transporter ATP-binding protein [Terasakiispira papahanaumokuakeensis]ODC04327.1 hypothetical protein BFW38_13095 [Terasakiispira papahanaumokuakeensis]